MATREPPEVGRARTALRSIPQDADTNVLMLAQTEGHGNFQPYRLNPTDALAAKFRAAATAFGTKVATEATLVRYQAGRKPDEHEVVYLSRAAVASLPVLVESLREPTDIPTFNPEGPEASQIRVYAVSVRVPNPGQLLFLRAMSMKSRLRRSRKIAAFFQGGVFDELEQDPLLFDEEFDAVVVGASVFVSHQRNFERAMDFLELARDAAQATLTSITVNLRIRNMNELLAAASSDINMISKLRGIAEKMTQSPGYATAMTMDRLVDFAQANPDVEIDFENDAGGNPELVYYGDVQRRWRILKLLDDDFLHSQLTNTNYESNSKSILG